MILDVQGLTVAYGAVVAVRDVSLAVSGGSVVAVIGANGAGKTSLLKGVIGQLPPLGGSVRFADSDVTGQRPYSLVRKGMAIVPQDRGTLAPLSVEENLYLAGRGVRSKAEVREGLVTVFDLFPALAERRRVRAGLLSGGEQQMLAFARALLTRPKLMLLDEPSTGLSPRLVEAVMASVRKLQDRGISVLVVEQNVAAVLDVADYAYVMDSGRLILEGTASEVRGDPAVQAAFLGVG